VHNKQGVETIATNIIVIYLESKIPCFTFKQSHIVRLLVSLPDAELIWCRTKEQYVEALPQATVVLSWCFMQEWFELAPHLRKIGTPAAGRDFFKVTSVPDHIEIRNGTFHGPVMAETVLGMILAVNRGILRAYKHQLQGELWPAQAVFGSRLIFGTHAVIIGFGKIGQAVGRLLNGFNVRVTGVRRNPSAERPVWFEASDVVKPLADLHSILPSADHVIMLLPSDTETDNFMGTREFELMSEHAVLYNFGRGNSIDEAALAAALRDGIIGGACLDVFQKEPLPESSPLADPTLPNLIRMPHASAFCESYLDRYLDEFIEWLGSVSQDAER
jgi:phosphoglycerate dehydrogenase-like enzyme